MLPESHVAVAGCVLLCGCTSPGVALSLLGADPDDTSEGS